MIAFDHIAISGGTLAEARSHVEEALGVAMQPGGEHDVFFTHNVLLGLDDGLYLEAIAINPNAPAPDRPRWFDLDRFSGPPRLTNWICRTDALAEILTDIPMNLGSPVHLKRGDLRWTMAVPHNGVLPYDNCAPALIQWQTKVHPTALLAPSSVRLRRLTICHPHAVQLEANLGAHLKDDRVAYETGPANLHAVFETPHGERAISG